MIRVQSSYQHPNDLEGLDLQPVESAVSPSQPQVQSSVTLPQWFTPQGRRRRGWSRALRWGLFWVGVAGIISSSGGLAVLWLFHTPASQCYALSALAAPGRRLFCAQQGAEFRGY